MSDIPPKKASKPPVMHHVDLTQYVYRMIIMGKTDNWVDSLVTDNIFTFLVGPDKKRFQLHAPVVSRLSAPFASMMNSHMKETVTRVVELPEVPPDVFGCFVNFAYRGDYSGESIQSSAWASMTIFEQVAGIMVQKGETRFRCQCCSIEIPIKDCGQFPFCARFQCKDEDFFNTKNSICVCVGCGEKATYQYGLLCDEHEEKYDIVENRIQEHLTGGPMASIQDFPFGLPLSANLLFKSRRPCLIRAPPSAKLALEHIRVALFAEMYAISSLQELATAKACWHLTLLQDIAEGVGGVLETISFIYQHTQDPDAGSEYRHRHIFRRLIAEFVETKLQTLATDSSFQTLLMAGGHFVSDLALARHKMMLRLQDTSGNDSDGS